MKIKFKKLKENAKVPRYEHGGDAGLDFCAVENGEVFPNSTKAISTGLAWEPIKEKQHKKYLLQIEGRSGLALKKSIDVYGGIVDETYRGEVKVIVHNAGDRVWEYKAGDKIAQGIIHELPIVEIEEVSELSDTERGSNGFGSSDKIPGELLKGQINNG